MLDVSYRPVDVISWQRAICYELFDKGDVIEYYDNKVVRSPSAVYQLPAVLRTRVYVKVCGAGSRALCRLLGRGA